MTLRAALAGYAVNPVLIREARAKARWRGTPACLSLFVVGVGILAVGLYARASAGSPEQSLGTGQWERVAYHAMSAQIVVVGILAAVLGAVSIAGERERHTLDLVVLGEITRRDMVAAKLGANVAFAMLLAVAALPIYTAVFLHSGLGLGPLMVAELLTLAMAVAATSVGLAAGSLSPSMLTAVVVAGVMVTTLFVDVVLSGEVPAPATGLPQTASQLLAGTHGRDTTDIVTDASGRLAVPSRRDLLVHPARQANPLYAVKVVVTGAEVDNGVPLGRIGRSLVPGGRSWSTWGLRVQPWQMSVVASALMAALFLALAVRFLGPRPAAPHRPPAQADRTSSPVGAGN